MNQYENYNFFIKRTKRYNPVGRNQTKKESDKISLDIQTNLGYIINEEIIGDEKAPEKIMNFLKDKNKI